MCGITGALSCRDRLLKHNCLKSMVDIIAHRGPDDAGYLLWNNETRNALAMTDSEFVRISPRLPVIDSSEGQRLLNHHPWQVFLGHRRLSIIDLSAAGHQPMGRRQAGVWLSYNGELYNYMELRAELEALGITFESQSDTEVILQSYLNWGKDCVMRFNGMFAFAIWDSRDETLHLVRDRYGIKPLYYSHEEGILVFGSEIKSLLAYLPEKPRVDLLALNEYFSFQNIFSDRTLFDGIRLLPPAHWMTVSRKDGNSSVTKYWDFDFNRENTARTEETEEKIYHLIQQAVKRQCVSDVPVASYLSGGMDSGSITAVASKHLGRIMTFTGGFDLSDAADHEMHFDERELAEKMAALFQTEHYERVLHAGDMPTVMNKLVWHLEDLRVGQSYPNYCIAKLAGGFVKVVLSGAGGDELFGGYPWRYAAAIAQSNTDFVSNYYKYWKRLVRNRDKPAFFTPDVREALGTLNDQGAIPFKDHTLSVFRRVLQASPRADTIEQQVNSALYFECKTFLHGLLLVDDKLSMAHSLETRVPFLDNDLVDFACTIPVRLKVGSIAQLSTLDENLLRKKEIYQSQQHAGKTILRSAMDRILPHEITSAKKQGFSAPDESWFRGKAHQYVCDTLLNEQSRSRNYLNRDFVQQVLADHNSGVANKRLLVWSLLSFETWLREFGL